METTVKISTKKIREDIKKLVEEQRFLKNQRKTVNLKGERKMPAWEAAADHHYNRIKLSIMYAALLVLRGEDFEKACNTHLSKKYPDWIRSDNKEKVKTIIEKYSKIDEDEV